MIAHTLAAGLVTAAFFVLAVSAYHLARKQHVDAFRISFKTAALIGIVSTILVGVVGHVQGAFLREVQPMAAAASEALYETADPAPFSVVALFDASGKKVIWSLDVPKFLSWLYFFKFEGEVEGIDNIQAQYTELYGPGDYVPMVVLPYWTFRIMVGVGFLMVALAAIALYFPFKKWPEKPLRWLKWGVWIVFLPYIANTAGWILTETGRQPWIVHGLLKTADGVSPQSAGMVLTSLIGYVLLYAILMVADVYLLVKFAKAGPAAAEDDAEAAAPNPTFTLTQS